MASTETTLTGLARSWGRPAAGALVGAVLFFITSQVMGRAGGTCMILCNPLVAIPYGAILGIFASGGPMKSEGTAPGDHAAR